MAENAKKHVFDFDSGIRVVACLIDSDEVLQSMESPLETKQYTLAPFLRLTASTEGNAKHPRKYPAKSMNILEAIIATHCFDLSGALVPSVATVTDFYFAFYYCPDCVMNWHESGKVPKIHFTA